MQDDPDFAPGRLRLGDFEVDLSTRELLLSGRRIRLQEKSFLVLNELLKNPGRAVTREELFGALWPKEHFVDAEHGLNTAVRRLREALGDSADTPRFIETLPKLGYRYVGPAPEPSDARTAGAGPGAPPPVESAEATFSPEPSAAPPDRGRARRVPKAFLLAAAIAVAAGVAALGLRVRSERRTSASAAEASRPRTSSAVAELLERSRYLRNTKRFEESRRFVEEALKLDPKSPEAVAGYALALLGEGKDSEARETAKRALELDPRAWEAQRVMAVLARAAGDLAGTERHLRLAIDAMPTDHKSRNRLARHFLEVGRAAEAMREMLESRRLAPDDPDVQNIWMDYALRTGDYEEAIRQGRMWLSIWENHLDMASTHIRLRDALGLAYVGARRHEEALAEFRAVDPDGDLRVALTLAHAGRAAEARAILAGHEARIAEGKEPADPGTDGALAMAYVSLGDFDRAFGHLDRQVSARWYPGWLNCPLFHGIRRDPRWAAFAERLDREFFRGEQRSMLPARLAGLQYWPLPSNAPARKG